MKLYILLVIGIVSILISGCNSDETPAEIELKILPQIAQELAKYHSSAKLKGITPEIVKALEQHRYDDITFQIGSPDPSSDTGISFYSKQDQKRFLALGLNLHASKDSYNVAWVGIGDKGHK
ncbi:MAG: hypothetical protein P4L99_11550 [Chthoniobacter sp.]|nr:hypothetical protein [Chthoniobacter sp.]